MGVDAQIFFDPGVPLTDREVEIANWRIIEATDERGYGTPPKLITRVTEEDGYRHNYGTGAPFQLSTGHRYYGEGYERGSWPHIASLITWLRLNWPMGRVWYGGDSGDTLPLIDDASMEDTWKHWAQYGGVPYRTARGGEYAPPCCGMPIFIDRWRGNRHGGYCPVCQSEYWVVGDRLEKIVKP